MPERRLRDSSLCCRALGFCRLGSRLIDKAGARPWVGEEAGAMAPEFVFVMQCVGFGRLGGRVFGKASMLVLA